MLVNSIGIYNNQVTYNKSNKQSFGTVIINDIAMNSVEKKVVKSLIKHLEDTAKGLLVKLKVTTETGKGSFFYATVDGDSLLNKVLPNRNKLYGKGISESILKTDSEDVLREKITYTVFNAKKDYKDKLISQ